MSVSCMHAAMKMTISASSWSKVSAFFYYVAVLSSFHLPVLSTWSEIYKYVGVSIVVGHYCDRTGLGRRMRTTNARAGIVGF